MKYTFLSLVLVTMLTQFAMADQNNNIICTSTRLNSSININTSTGKIMYNSKYEIQNPVYSGVYSTINYTGEILAEASIEGAEYYVTLIIRSKSGSPELEAFWYPKNNRNIQIHYFLDSCKLN